MCTEPSIIPPKIETQGLSITTPEWESNTVVYNPTSISDKVGRLASRFMIDSYEKRLKEIAGSETGEVDEINANGLTEYFVGGSYVRSLLIPKGFTLVSKLWTKERLWVIVSGEVSFRTELGTRRIKAPFIEVAPFGSKVALYAHEDTLWLAITGADSTNSEDVEKEMVAKDYTELTYPWDRLEHEGDTE